MSGATYDSNNNRIKNSWDGINTQDNWDYKNDPVVSLDESRIISTSYPYIFAKFKASIENASVFLLTSDFKDLTNMDSITGGSASITGAVIEGMVPYARKGTISLIDPTGQWAEHLIAVGAESNHYLGGTGPNIFLSFGWRGLKSESSSETRSAKEFTREIEGLIIKVEQDMTAEGIFTATIEFIEYTNIATNDIKFLRAEDMQLGIPKILFDMGINKVDDPAEEYSNTTKAGYHTRGGTVRAPRMLSDNANSLDKLTTAYPQDLLKLVCHGSSDPEGNNGFFFSVGKQLQNKKILYFFSGSQNSKEISQAKYPKIRFGDNLVDYIKDVIALIEPEESFFKAAEDEQYLLSYEKGNPISISEGDTFCEVYGESIKFPENSVVSIIPYYWKRTPNESKAMDDENWNDMFKPPGPRLKKGPNLVYKYDGIIKKERKLIIDWSSDLSSHSHLIHLFQDELSEKFSSYTESDWTNLEEIFEEEGLENSSMKIENEAHKLTSAVSAGKDISDNKRYKYYRSSGMIETMTEVAKALDKGRVGMRSASLRSVIMDNAFKANAVIMGDPSLGTELKGAETELTTDFWTVGDLAGTVFSRKWLLLKSVHTFEEGKYTTNIELLGYPDPPKNMAHERDKWAEMDKKGYAMQVEAGRAGQNDDRGGGYQTESADGSGE